MIYIFDIDGTLADLTHRLHFIQQEPKDWNSFYRACKNDEAISDVIALGEMLCEFGYRVIISSGRDEMVRDDTVAWLRHRGMPFRKLYMRKHGDHREDSVVKSEMLDEILKDFPEGEVSGVFEDRQQVVDMYRARGLRVYQVAKGDF